MTETEVDTEVAATLERADQRYTGSRRRLVAVLQAGEGPLTINQIVATDKSIPQSTAYRNLTILEDVGVVTRIVTGDDFARYELAEHLTEHHHHLICSTCGSITDFFLDAATEAALDKALGQAANEVGFESGAHTLDLHGTCAKCKRDS